MLVTDTDVSPQTNYTNWYYSRIEYMLQLKWLFFIVVFSIVSPISQAKKRCKPLLQKLQNIQAMQRHGYSVKRGVSLRAKEDKARDKWWQCENSRDKKSKKTKKNSKSNKVSYSTALKRADAKNINAGTPFKTNNAIVVKSKYHGDKKRAWLAFYQQPTRCHRPKNLQVFAFCSEDKQTQRADFEQVYSQGSEE
mgnify:CR=1 FL=1